jgi:hypothetical protein
VVPEVWKPAILEWAEHLNLRRRAAPARRRHYMDAVGMTIFTGDAWSYIVGEVGSHDAVDGGP